MALPPGAARPIRHYGPVNWLGLTTLFRREFRAYLKDWLETVVAPTFSTLIYVAVFALAAGPDPVEWAGPGGLPHFLAPGLVIYVVVLRAAETTVYSLTYFKIERLLGDILMPPLASWEIAAGYALAGTAAGLVTGLPCLVAMLLFAGTGIADPALLGLALLLGAFLLAAAGTLVGLWAQKWDQAAAFFGFLLIPVTFLSGVFAPVALLPGPLAGLVALNPIYYAIDAARIAFGGVGAEPVGRSLAVLAASGAALWACSAVLIARGWRIKP
ncbi:MULTISPECIES: ABC transporter permease [Inquilinus]|uniref:Transport permease protein n=1 Tax=Inquilinus ginsengisoli TaxID=363840 RepID=A0ABU1JV64_9PROT|nr:ABC transporter permease [Inquilinus ginsengisoli]MDR6292524.1 ABC-2 type transport system permease protein [Inquilinus ginsengisoli]